MKLLATILLLTFFTLQSSFGQLTTRKGGHCYSLDIPDYMVKTFELNDVASLQYMNAAKEAYVVVIEDSKEQMQSAGLKYVDAKDFLENFLNTYNKDAAARKVGEISKFKSNNNTLAQAEFTWKDDKTSYFMITTAVESKTHFYKILVWTIGENEKTLKSDFLAISKSLKD